MQTSYSTFGPYGRAMTTNADSMAGSNVGIGDRRDIAAEAPDGPGYAYVDGRLCPPIAEAAMPLMDWGILRSDATYDVIKVTNGRFFRLDDHLARLRSSAGRLGFQIAESWEDVPRILAMCVDRSGLETCVTYAIITRGVPPLGMNRDPRAARNQLYAMAVPIPGFIAPGDGERALSVAIGSERRIDKASLDPTIKNFHWLDMIQSLRGAFAEEADTTILLDMAGHVTEGPGFNVFVLADGGLKTPERGVLEGITRRTAIEIAGELGVPCAEATVSAEDLLSAREAFGTSTAGGIVPFGRIDGRVIGDGRPGPLTRRIRDRLDEMQASPDWTVGVGEILSP
jgi:branched-chain amino acid aminotransferase